jgi:hypothetical protein
MTNITTEHYLQFWNADTTEAQHRLAAMTFTDDISYHAPIGVLRGTDALIGFRNQLTDHVGPLSFGARVEPESHHDRVRLAWEIQLANGESFATGTDVMVLEADGRVSSVSAFLDRAPDGFDLHAHG